MMLPLAQGAPDWSMMLPLGLIAVLFYFLFIRTEKRQRDKHRSMVEGLTKNDRVVTIGGIKGSVVSVRKDADEVVLKIDDNVRIRVTLGAIARVEGARSEGGSEPAEDKPAS